MKETMQELLSQLEAIENSKSLNIDEKLRQAMIDYTGDDEIVSFKRYQELHKNQIRTGFKTKLSKLDEFIEEFHEGDVVTITAPTGQGKTSFCCFLTSMFSQQNIKTLWFCYENSVMNLIQKFGEDLPQSFLPQILTTRKLVWIEKKIIEAIVKYGIKVVFIDHLHYLFDLNTTRNPSLAIGEIMREFKIMAKKYGITIFMVAHTGKVREDDIVGLESIRDSSFVAQESDYVIALWRVREKQKRFEMKDRGLMYTNETMISVVKNRYTGRLGSFKTIYSNNKFMLEAPQSIVDMGNG